MLRHALTCEVHGVFVPDDNVNLLPLARYLELFDDDPGALLAELLRNE